VEKCTPCGDPIPVCTRAGVSRTSRYISFSGFFSAVIGRGRLFGLGRPFGWGEFYRFGLSPHRLHVQLSGFSFTLKMPLTKMALNSAATGKWNGGNAGIILLKTEPEN